MSERKHAPGEHHRPLPAGLPDCAGGRPQLFFVDWTLQSWRKFSVRLPGLGDGMWHFLIAHSISPIRLKKPRDHKILLQWMNFVKYVIFSGNHFPTDSLLYCLALEKCPMVCNWALLFIYSNQRWSWNLELPSLLSQWKGQGKGSYKITGGWMSGSPWTLLKGFLSLSE